MRCSNCGWNNPDGIDKCQKCNQQLSPYDEIPVAPNIDASAHDNETKCPKCGYLISSASQVCPLCGTSMIEPASAPFVCEHDTKTDSLRKTVIVSEPEHQKLSNQTIVDCAAMPSNVGFNPKATVCDFIHKESDDVTPSTVIDPVHSEPVNDGKTVVENASNNIEGFKYQFECMDSQDLGVIFILSDRQLDFTEGEIILVSGNRYRKI